ncbi:MAG TPA: hypothetical protein VG319_02920 [Polyangia bacterium]|jgi:hypothetical protein|nr:hypothetical protein [Polyangia bacterium]
MIPYEELDKALARWKARAQNAAVEGARAYEGSGAVPAVVPSGVSGRLPPPPDRTGEIDLGDSVVESYEEEPS